MSESWRLLTPQENYRSPTDRQSIAPREIEVDLILSERLRIRQCNSTYQSSLSFDYRVHTSYLLMECIAAIPAFSGH